MKRPLYVVTALSSTLALSCSDSLGGIDIGSTDPDSVETVVRLAVERPPVNVTTVRVNSETLNYDPNQGAEMRRGGAGLFGNVTSNFYRNNIQTRVTYGPVPADIDLNRCTFQGPVPPPTVGAAQKVEFRTPTIVSLDQVTALSRSSTTRLVTGTFGFFGGEQFLGVLWNVEGVCHDQFGDVVQRSKIAQIFIKGARGCGSRGVGTSWCGGFNPGGTCWCDPSCVAQGDCCEDFKHACTTD